MSAPASSSSSSSSRSFVPSRSSTSTYDHAHTHLVATNDKSPSHAIERQFLHWVNSLHARHEAAASAEAMDAHDRRRFPVRTAARALIDHMSEVSKENKDRGGILETPLVDILQYLDNEPLPGVVASSYSDRCRMHDAWRHYRKLIEGHSEQAELFRVRETREKGYVVRWFRRITMANMFSQLVDFKTFIIDMVVPELDLFWTMRAELGEEDGEKAEMDQRYEPSKKKRKVTGGGGEGTGGSLDEEGTRISRQLADDQQWMGELSRLSLSFSGHMVGRRLGAFNDYMSSAKGVIARHFRTWVEHCNASIKQTLADMTADGGIIDGVNDYKQRFRIAADAKLVDLLKFVQPMSTSDASTLSGLINRPFVALPPSPYTYDDPTTRAKYGTLIQQWKYLSHIDAWLHHISRAMVDSATVLRGLFPVPLGFDVDFGKVVQATAQMQEMIIEEEKEIQVKIAEVEAKKASGNFKLQQESYEMMKRALQKDATTRDAHAFMATVYTGLRQLSLSTTADRGTYVKRCNEFINRLLDKLRDPAVDVDAQLVHNSVAVAAFERTTILALQLDKTANVPSMLQLSEISTRLTRCVDAWKRITDLVQADMARPTKMYALDPASKWWCVRHDWVIRDDDVKELRRLMRECNYYDFVRTFNEQYVEMNARDGPNNATVMEYALRVSAVSNSLVDTSRPITLLNMMRGIEYLITTMVHYEVRTADTAVKEYKPTKPIVISVA